jgi:hypothetical protein
MAVSESIKSQFVEYIKLQAFDDSFISRTEEKNVLEVGVKNGIGVEESLSIIREVAKQKGIVVERDVEDRTKEFLKNAVNDGSVSKKEFEDAVELYKTACKGKVKESDIKHRIKQIMLDNEWKAKEGLFSGGSWFSTM